MDTRQSPTPEEALLFGTLLLALSTFLIGMVLFRFEWLQRSSWQFLMRWGRGGWSFPASRFGAFAGSLVAAGFSLALLDQYFELLSHEGRIVLVMGPLLLVVVAAVYDYRLHRRRSRAYADRRSQAGRRLPVASMTLADLYAALRDAGDDDVSAVEARLRQKARQEPEAFASFLRTIEFDEDCALGDVYLALIDEAESHVDLLLAEFERLMALAEGTPGNRVILEQLRAYEWGDGPDALERGIVSALLGALASPAVQIRRCAAWLASTFLSASTPALEERVRDVQRSDPDWRVRVLAHQSLRDFRGEDRRVLPVPEPAVADRIRAHVVGSVHDFTA